MLDLRCLLLLLMWSAAAVAAEPVSVAIAEQHADRGRWRLAMMTYRTLQAQAPEDPRVRLGIARAQAGLGRCEEALPALEALRAEGIWGPAAAASEALCHLHGGRTADAAVALEEARRDGAGVEALLQLALVRVALGEPVETLLVELQEAGSERLVALVRASLALVQGDPLLDMWLDRANRMDGPSLVQLRILDARRWMDLADPQAAFDSLGGKGRREHAHPQLVLWRVEALRRLGRTEDARATLADRVLARRMGGPLAVALHARLLTDEGRLGEALALLADHPDPTGEEALASAWYLARARGQDDRAAALERLWSLQVQAADRSLAQLLPLTASVEAP